MDIKVGAEWAQCMHTHARHVETQG
jgi:hypothetical protein